MKRAFLFLAFALACDEPASPPAPVIKDDCWVFTDRDGRYGLALRNGNASVNGPVFNNAYEVTEFAHANNLIICGSMVAAAGQGLVVVPPSSASVGETLDAGRDAGVDAGAAASAAPDAGARPAPARITGGYSVELPPNGTPCSAPSGPSCTVIVPAIDVVSWLQVCVSLANVGASALGDGLIEWSPDGVYFELYDSNTFDRLPARTSRSACIRNPGRRWFRVEGRSHSGTQILAQVTGGPWFADGGR